MPTSNYRRFALILVLAFLAVSCAVPGASYRPPLPPDLATVRPIPANVLLLMPYEFEGLVHAGFHRGGEIHLPLGRQAADLVAVLLRNSFYSVNIMPVRSEAEATGMVSSGVPEIQQYDFVAIPKFAKVSSWERDREYGYDISLSLAFHSPDSMIYEIIGGHGESKTGIHAGSSPRQSASLALTSAVDAIKDGLELKRNALTPRPR